MLSNVSLMEHIRLFIHREKGLQPLEWKIIFHFEEKERRLQDLNKLINKYSKESNDKLLNKIVTVLIEGHSEKKKDMLMGYTDTFKLVNIKGDEKYIGKIVDVKITDIKSWSLNGVITDEN